MGWRRLAAYIRSEITARGWTQRDLADRAGVTVNSINTILSGHEPSRWPGKTIPGIERALDWEPGTALRIVEGGPGPNNDEPPEPSDLADAGERRIWQVGVEEGWPVEERWQLIYHYRSIRQARRRQG